MITVLRLSHRAGRDKRITTHCGLVARAFGADSIVISGDRDEKLISSLMKVEQTWGGPFEVSYLRNWKEFLGEKKRAGWKVVHLTMYGEDFRKKMKVLGNNNLVLVVGSEKVPQELYELADYNISVGNQPHSEVAALGVLLYELNGIKKEFKNRKLGIVPSKRGKRFK